MELRMIAENKAHQLTIEHELKKLHQTVDVVRGTVVSINNRKRGRPAKGTAPAVDQSTVVKQ
jgi:hypothetical protein